MEKTDSIGNFEYVSRMAYAHLHNALVHHSTKIALAIVTVFLLCMMIVITIVLHPKTHEKFRADILQEIEKENRLKKLKHQRETVSGAADDSTIGSEVDSSSKKNI